MSAFHSQKRDSGRRAKARCHGVPVKLRVNSYGLSVSSLAFLTSPISSTRATISFSGMVDISNLYANIHTIFGNPNDATTWVFGMPSIWVWQIIWWALGVGMMWMLAYKLEMSTMPEKDIVALVEDIGDVKKARLDTDRP